jgi:tetratricopeptide (TPR) repeat protein
MEQTDSFFPKHPNRRWVLAKLLQMPPAFMAEVGLDEHEPPQPQPDRAIIPNPSKHVNFEAYYTKLQSYSVDGYPDGIESAIDDIKARIHRLYAVIHYSRQKPQVARLLCGYQIMLANIAKQLQCYKASTQYFNNAITIAEEYECRDLLGIALFRRQATFADIGDYPSALAVFERAKKQGYFASPLQGVLLSVAGKSQAALAQDKSDLSAALSYLDAAEKLTGEPEAGNFLFFAAFDKENYFLYRATALMNPPDEKLRSPDKAEKCLVEVEKQRRIAGKSISAGKSIRTSRQAHSDLIQAKIYYDQGYDPVAAATAENVLIALNQDSGFVSSSYLKQIADLLQGLKQRAPGEEFVTCLELELMKRQQPYLFN